MEIESEEKCPVPGAHARLGQSHRLWHQALKEYADPQGFCTNLNATVQALRSVTFILQKEKRAIPNFEVWYRPWQDRLKEDADLRWLIQARNRIEKEGDLSSHSIVKISVLAGWNGPMMIAEESLDPLTPTMEVLEKVQRFKLSPEIQRDGVVIIERMWIVKDFPDRELLDLLAHCYGVLATLLADAHRQCGFIAQVLQAEQDGAWVISDEHLEGRLPCMVAPIEARTLRLHLGENVLASPAQIFVKADPKDREGVLAKYKTTQGSLERQPGEDMVSWSGRWFEHAKNVLATDGYHQSMMLLLLPDGETELHSLQMEDRQSVYMVMHELALRIARVGAVGLISIGEFWAANPLDLAPGQKLSEASIRKEILSVHAATAEGKLWVHAVEFWRDSENRITFGQYTGSNQSEGHWGFLEPLHQIWKRRKGRTPSMGFKKTS